MRHTGHVLTWLTLLMSVLRLLMWLALLLWLLPSWSSLQAHWALRQLPPVAAVDEARALAEETRYAEALMVLDLAPGTPEAAHLRASIEASQQDWRYRGRQLLVGAWHGQGETPEALAGAVVADLLVFGDVRDLVIQGHRAARDAPVDPVIVALSSLGLVSTATPAADTGLAVLKVGRRSGALSGRLSRQLTDMGRDAVRSGDFAPLRTVARMTSDIADQTDPAIALRLLRSVRGVDDLPHLQRLVRSPETRYAVWAGGAPVLDLSRRHGPDIDPLLRQAARHGRDGVVWVVRQSPQLLRVHPLLGTIKAWYKGHLPSLLEAVWPQLVLMLQGLVMAMTLLSGIRVLGAVRPLRTKKRGLFGPRFRDNSQ